MVAVGLLKRLLAMYQTAWRHILEGCNIHANRRVY